MPRGYGVFCPPAPQSKAGTWNELDKQTVRVRRQANAYPHIAFPLRSEIEIQDREQQVLRLAEWVKGGDRSHPTIVLQASTDLGGDGIAEFCGLLAMTGF